MCIRDSLWTRLPLPAYLVPQQQEDRLHRQSDEDSDLRRRQGNDDGGGQRTVLLRGQPARIHRELVTRQPVAGVCTRTRKPQLCHCTVRYERRNEHAGHHRLLFRQQPVVRPGRKVSFLHDQQDLLARVFRLRQYVDLSQLDDDCIRHARRGDTIPSGRRTIPWR